MIFHRKSIFDILREAEDETPNDSDEKKEENDKPETDNNTDEKDTDNSEDDTNTDNVDNDDEDFSIDTNLDDEDNIDNESSDDDSSSASDDTTSTMDNGNDSSSSEDKPVKSNTDIFNSLTAEEQKIKIQELKNLYGELYSSCNDLLERINMIDLEDDIIDVTTRISMTLYSLKKYIGDYINSIFSSKSYIENDIAFNRFLSILNSVSNIVDEIASYKNEKMGKYNKK